MNISVMMTEAAKVLWQGACPYCKSLELEEGLHLRAYQILACRSCKKRWRVSPPGRFSCAEEM
jgi:hypothetical protein